MKKLLIIALISGLLGCSTLREKLCNDAVITDKVIQLDLSYYQECKPLNNLPEKATFEDVITNMQLNAIVYAECRNKLHDNISILKKLSNYKEPIK